MVPPVKSRWMVYFALGGVVKYSNVTRPLSLEPFCNQSEWLPLGWRDDGKD